MKTFKICSDEGFEKAKSALTKACRRRRFSLYLEKRIVAAVMEIAYNAFQYAKKGKMTIHELENGIEVIVEDQGPGIADVEKAMQERYSTKNGFGLGLPVAKMVMDEFEITSSPEMGTKIVMRKFLPK